MDCIYYYSKTKEYYYEWLDITNVVESNKIILQESLKREVIQKGYSSIYDVYCLKENDKIYISYSKDVKKEIDQLSYTDVKESLQKIFHTKAKTSIAYYFTELPQVDLSLVKQLTLNDYHLFYTFFKTQYPDSNPDEWLYDYFKNLIEKGYAYGIFIEGILVSVTETPDIPYMSEIIVEPGINTLQEYRKKGYAKMVCSALIQQLLDEKKIPIWTCDESNIRSQKLAESLGFKKLGEIYTISLEK